MQYAWMAVVLVIAALAGAFYLKSKEGRAKPARARSSKPAEVSDTLQGWVPTATRVLTHAEREAYHVLRKALPDHMLLAQVPLARFLKVPTRNSYNEWLRRVGSLCADIVVCDATSQVIAVVELRQPVKQENPRAVRRHARMDRVLKAAAIPVHVWLEGALPGAAVAREAILGAALSMPQRPAGTNSRTRRSAEAAAVVASMQSAGAMHGLSVNEHGIDFNMEDYLDDARSEPDSERKDPPPSTWFDDMDSAPMPLDALAHH